MWRHYGAMCFFDIFLCHMYNGPLGRNFSELLIGIYSFSLRKNIWKYRLENGSHFCLGLYVLTSDSEKCTFATILPCQTNLDLTLCKDAFHEFLFGCRPKLYQMPSLLGACVSSFYPVEGIVREEIIVALVMYVPSMAWSENGHSIP